MSAEAVEKWLKFLTPYQRQWVFEPSRFAVCVKARQIGFSHATAAAAVVGGLIDQRTQIILSAAQGLSDEVLDKARRHCEMLASLGMRKAIQFRTNNTTELEWMSGGKIVSLPANPRTARSFSGDVYLDEAAYHTDPQGIRDATLPMAMRGDYRYRIISTPNGATGLFYETVTNPPPGWAVRRVTIDDAISQGFAINREELFHSVAGSDERLFGQWFGCQFLDADMQYIPTELADRALNWDGHYPNPDYADVFAGLDVGRVNDLTVLTVVALMNGVAYVLPLTTCARTKFKEQRDIIAKVRDKVGWSKLFVDQTGMGMDMAEELREDFGEDEVQPVTFTLQSKEDLATRALRWLRDDRIRFPRGEDGRALHADTTKIRRIVTSSGNVQYDGPRSEGGHCDRFWSLCLALKGAGEPIAPSGMGTVPLMPVA